MNVVSLVLCYLIQVVMAHQFPSIQSFFPRTALQDSKNHTGSSAEFGDGFTAEEVDAVLHPLLGPWTPTQVYEEIEIGCLIPGPQRVTFMGRIVNLYDQPTPSKKPQAARGCLKVILKDDTGAIVVGSCLIRTR